MLPGAVRAGGRLGYTPARPLLHYARTVLEAAGLAVLEAWWSLDDAGDARDAWLAEQARAAVDALPDDLELRLLAGKSLGTTALATLAEVESVPSVWLTPLLRDAPVVRALERARRALVVGGTDDELFDVDLARRLPGEHLIVEGADHALQRADAAESVRALADFVRALTAFVCPAEPEP